MTPNLKRLVLATTFLTPLATHPLPSMAYAYEAGSWNPLIKAYDNGGSAGWDYGAGMGWGDGSVGDAFEDGMAGGGGGGYGSGGDQGGDDGDGDDGDC